MLLRRLSLLTVLMLAIGGTSAAIAAPRDRSSPLTVAQSPNEPSQGPREGKGKGRWIEQLNLSEDQQQQIEQIRSQKKEEMASKRQQLQQAQEQLEQLMIGTASDNDIRNQHREVLQLRQEMAEMHFDQMLAIRGVLTPEQRQQFAQIMQQRRPEGSKPRGNQGRQQRGRGNAELPNDDTGL